MLFLANVTEVGVYEIGGNVSADPDIPSNVTLDNRTVLGVGYLYVDFTRDENEIFREDESLYETVFDVYVYG